MTTLQLEEANTSDILEIMRETRIIWSGGLTPDKCIQSIHTQLTHPWGKKHLRYLLLRSQNEICSSLKFYSISLSGRSSESKRRQFNFAGLGAIYTMVKHRNKGLGGQLVKSAIDLARAQNLDGLLLYSDIDPGFYANFGFVQVSSSNFEMQPLENISFNAHITTPEKAHVTSLTRSYNNWLPKREYGCNRSELFWNYKIAREKFFHNFSALEWPGIELMTLNNPSDEFSAYALIEKSSTTLRVLEVVGREELETRLWHQIHAYAGKAGTKRIRGFEGCLPPAMKYQLVEREWAWPMILPLNPDTKNWLNAQPCPLLELDHF